MGGCNPGKTLQKLQGAVVPMSNYFRIKGEHLTIKGTAVDDNGNAVDVSSGYSFFATVKQYHGDADAAAEVDIDSDSESSRFSASSNTVTVTVMTSAETDMASTGRYFFDIWAKRTSDNQQTLIDSGIILITDSATDTK